ncbi:MAG: 1,4-dihydroxy-2-naphthoate polyprenyltransferase [Actinomycetota bacterium]|jgi:1,4-dihydroxy-2-naphthoate octaprenyltransferase|nr:1,4-dihydroxy-2-naphthoate polyprenyltransferase [Actinomycetota bacterium]
MATIGQWVQGARPRTLPAALVPVVVATAAATADGHFIWDRAVLALVVSLAIQVATNYANDYSDGKRGTDDKRVGPMRLVASGAAAPKVVLYAALACFGIAGIAGLALAVMTSWILILVGALALLAGWFYTGGKRPYGYMGLGEVFVFVFFGLVAVVGTYYVQTGGVGYSLLLSVPVGLLAVALLVINNLRDIPTDAASGKMTLAVRLGDRGTRYFYVGVIVLSLLLAVALSAYRPFAWLGVLAAPLALRPTRVVMAGATGPELIRALAMTGALQIAFGVLLSLGVLL